MIRAWLLIFYLSTGQPVEIDDFSTKHACEEAALHFREAYVPVRHSCMPLFDDRALPGEE